MTQAERQQMREWNKAQARAYHHSRKWYNVDHLSGVLAPLRARLRRLK